MLMGVDPRTWSGDRRVLQSDEYVFATDRLMARDIKEDDFDELQGICSNPQVCRFLDWDPQTPAETQGFIRKALADQKGELRNCWSLAIINQSDGRLIGLCRFSIESMKHKLANIGFLFTPEVWGQEYATEIAKGLCSFGFKKLGLHRIEATCHTENIGSFIVLIKSGMTQEAVLRKDHQIDGQWCDSYLFSVLEDD